MQKWKKNKWAPANGSNKLGHLSHDWGDHPKIRQRVCNSEQLACAEAKVAMALHACIGWSVSMLDYQTVSAVLTVLLFWEQQQSLPTVGHHKGFCHLKWTRPPFVHQVPTAATSEHTWPACQQHICTWGMPATYLSKISVKTYWKFCGRTSTMSKSCKITWN